MSDEIILPPIGQILIHRGKPYTLAEREPYVRKGDGGATYILRFTGECRHPDCTVPVEPSIGAVDYFHGKTIHPTACTEHKGWIDPESLEAIKKARRGRRKRGRPRKFS